MESALTAERVRLAAWASYLVHAQRLAAEMWAAASPPVPRAPLTKEQALQQAHVEGLTLRKSDNTSGFFGVSLMGPGQNKPFQGRVTRNGKTVALGAFVTAEEAALCVARSPEGQAVAAERAASPSTITGEEARQQAQVEGLVLLMADNKAGYFGVSKSQSKYHPFKAAVRRGDKQVHLGSFATAAGAALCVARSPEGQAVATERAASPTRLLPPLLSRSGRRPEREAPVPLTSREPTECRKRQRVADALPCSHARSPSWLRPGGRPERRNSGGDDDADEEVEEAAAMATIEVLDAVAVKHGDDHHHEAVVVEAELVLKLVHMRAAGC